MVCFLKLFADRPIIFSQQPLIKRKLLILDCNGLLWGSRPAKVPQRPGNTMSKNGIHFIGYHIYYERLRLHQFLSLCFAKFDVAIWTCAGKARTNAMVDTIFTEEERRQFKFIWNQSMTTDSGVERDDVKCNVFLKDLRQVWKHRIYNGVYDDTNTILIDDSPIKAFVNPTFTGLFPTTFQFGDSKDTFLLDILWPLLDKLSCAIDVQRFLRINTPKWSSKNERIQLRHQSEAYEMLQIKYKWSKPKPSVPTYTILDVSEHEVTYQEKSLINKLSCKLSVAGPITQRMFDTLKGYAISLLGRDYEGPYCQDYLGFIEKIQGIRKSSTKFDYDPLITKCNRDVRVDRDRTKLTCSNARCRDCA